MKFKTSLILTAISGRMLLEGMSLRDFNKVMGVMLSVLTGEWPELWQLQRFADECTPYIKKQLPWLEEVLAREEWNLSSDWWSKNYQQFITSVEEQYGSEHELTPIPPDDHDHIHPAVEFAKLFPDKVIFSKTDPDSAANN